MEKMMKIKFDDSKPLEEGNYIQIGENVHEGLGTAGKVWECVYTKIKFMNLGSDTCKIFNKKFLERKF